MVGSNQMSTFLHIILAHYLYNMYIYIIKFIYNTYTIRSVLKIVILINSHQQFTIRSEISKIHTEILQLGDSIPEHVSQ